MKRNWLAVSAISAASFTPNPSQRDYPSRDAWLAARVRLSQLMRQDDFAAVAMYYSDLELLEDAINRNDRLMVGWYADKAREHERPAMQTIEGYCAARWRLFRGHGPGPLSGGGWGSSLLSPQSQDGEGAATEASADGDDEG
jgi:hypothetical protein